MTLSYRLSAFASMTLGIVALSACQDEHRIAEDFISDDPTAGNADDDYGDEASESTDGGETGDSGDDGGELEVLEADIVQMEGDRLYALSTYSGLTVVDMTDPDNLRSLGAWETDAEPFEMYVESSQAFIMFNDFGFWAWDEGFDDWSYETSSRLIALDAANPAAIAATGEFSLPGRIQDSRRVGDVLYLVTLQDGWCWGCGVEQKTVVTSLDITDEAHPAIIDQLEFTADDDNWDWQRSVESTSERMYIASNTWNWEGLGSFIDVIDISAGDGSLVTGAQIQVSGSVFSRWQMNEYEGVLRVTSQFAGSDNPVIETFTIESSQSFVPLGSGSLSLPMPESLRSARFDGDRAYAITAEQTDPLFTIDLSDPASPQQVGELEIPGWVYHMETRDDRVMALGFDPGNPEGSINVSLFDVGVFDSPTLRRRVHFGGNWANFAEDQNRIHKAFSILDDEAMILVPHQGWSFSDGDACSGDYRSGVQIIDWKDDDLTLRGLVPARGRARRAFTHRERIVTVSDMQLATFDFADRDAPIARDQVALAVRVDDLVAVGEVWVRVARDWWTSSQVLEVVSAADPASPEPLGVIDLGHDPCESTWIEGLFGVGDHVFVVQSVESWTELDYASTIRIVSVDIGDPTAPMIDDTLEIPGARSWGISQLANVSTRASWLAQHGDHLALLSEDKQVGKPQIHVVDLSEPAELALAATLERPEGQIQGALSVMSDTIVSWHNEPVEGQPGKVRFYFDRLDLGGDAPSWASEINVPGIIVAYDAEAGRAFTVDFEIEQVDLDATECYRHPKYWSFEWDGADGPEGESGTCQLIDRTLEQLDIYGSHAYGVRTFDIEGDAGLDQLFASDSRIFAKADESWWDAGTDGFHANTRLVLVDIGSAEVQVHEIDGEQFGAWWEIVAVQDERAVVQDNYGNLGLIDAGVIGQPEVTTSALPGWSDCHRPVIDGDRVYCPMGEYGLETVEW